MQSVGAKLEEATKFSRRCGWPEGEFLHEGRLFVGYQLFEVGIECRKFRVGSDGVERCMVAVISLILPNVDCSRYQSNLDTSTTQ